MTATTELRLRRPCHHRPRLRRRIAVVYFTKTGNTKSLAEAVRHMTGGGLMHTREAFEALLAGRRLGTHLTVYGAVRPQDAKVRKTAVSDARNTITDRNPTWRGLNLPTV